MLRLARNYVAQARAASGANIVLGLWMLASPWVFDYSGKAAVLSSLTVGALVALLAAIRVASLHDSAGLSGINLLFALWTVVSPRVYGYITNEGALLNNIAVGLLIAALASWSAIATDAEQRRRPDTSAH
jgi:hypothetical protein